MAYKRKRGYTPKSKSARTFRKAIGGKRWTALRNKRLVTTIKRVVLKTSEPKQKHTQQALIEMYHNAPVLISMNNRTAHPIQGVGDDMRVGDRINQTGFKLRWLFGQKYDRPNVSFRYWIIEVPKGYTYDASTWFDRTTNNYMLDDINSDKIKTLKTGVWRPNQAGLSAIAGTTKEFTFTRKLSVSRKKLIKFTNDADTYNNDDDLYFLVVAYDAYGTLVQDNIAYIQGCITMYYKDP